MRVNKYWQNFHFKTKLFCLLDCSFLELLFKYHYYFWQETMFSKYSEHILMMLSSQQLEGIWERQAIWTSPFSLPNKLLALIWPHRALKNTRTCTEIRAFQPVSMVTTDQVLEHLTSPLKAAEMDCYNKIQMSYPLSVLTRLTGQTWRSWWALKKNSINNRLIKNNAGHNSSRQRKYDASYFHKQTMNDILWCTVTPKRIWILLSILF